MSRRLLLVEDEPLLREVVAEELRDLGYCVFESSDGEEATRILAAEALDCLITDIRLPGGMDGWTIAERARELHPDLRVVYMTGFAATLPRQVPGSKLVLKPFNPAELDQLLREAP